ncbi:MAG: hypothetical protein JW829_10535 [Pirellulales bacterium]|nr:hypothetical protein [Pirellulales bacterium]
MMGFFASATFVASLIGSFSDMPQWESDYGRALKATRENGRPLLIVLEVPKKPAGRLEPIRSSEDKVAGADPRLLVPYQLCHVDVTTKYGKQVAKVFHASRYPFVAIIDRTGQCIIFKKTGQMTDSEWQTVLTRHKNGDLPPTQIAGVGQSHYQSSLDPSYCPSCQNGGW